MARQDRLKEVYDYVRSRYPIHTKIDFSDALKYNRAYISSAMNGNERYLTDKLFTNICEAFPGVFNLGYLLTGEGELLAPEEQVLNEDVKNNSPAPSNDETLNMLELYARMIRGVDDLRVELKNELTEVQQIKADLQQARDDFRDATYRLTQALSRLNSGPSDSLLHAADK